MITINNYTQEINRIGVNNLPDTLRKSHEFTLKSTQNGSDLETYNKNDIIRRAVDLYLSKLNEIYPSPKDSKSQTAPTIPKKNEPQPYPKSASKKIKPDRPAVKKHDKSTSKAKEPSYRVRHIKEEVKFIKRYVGLHNKVKSKNAILSFLKALQRSIVQKLIEKTSPLAKEIEMIQDRLVNTYNSMKDDRRIEINDKDLAKLVGIAGGEEVYPSIRFIKRFIGMQAKPLKAEQIESFTKQLKNAVDKKKVLRDDPYADKLNAIYQKLTTQTGSEISLTKTELNGLEGILKGCGCTTDRSKIRHSHRNEFHTGIKSISPYSKNSTMKSTNGELNGVMSAQEMANLVVDRLDFNEVYKRLFGRPARNFTMILHGEPEAGKTTFLLKFAKYLAENFGRVLYITSEEYGATTMIDKINELVNPQPANLFFSGNHNEKDLSDYDFVIFDSVNDLGLRYTDYQELRKNNRDVAFILILQHTKSGDYKGGKDWEHATEIAGKVEKGVINIYRNRYGVKGTMNFFNDNQLKSQEHII